MSEQKRKDTSRRPSVHWIVQTNDTVWSSIYFSLFANIYKTNAQRIQTHAQHQSLTLSLSLLLHAIRSLWNLWQRKLTCLPYELSRLFHVSEWFLNGFLCLHCFLFDWMEFYDLKIIVSLDKNFTKINTVFFYYVRIYSSVPRIMEWTIKHVCFFEEYTVQPCAHLFVPNVVPFLWRFFFFIVSFGFFVWTN